MDRNIILKKSEDFAVEIVQLSKTLMKRDREYVLSKQLLRSATSIGANVREAQYAQSKADFIAKMSIALKEANETEYWLVLLHRTSYIPDDLFPAFQGKCKELIKILIQIVKNAKSQDGHM